MEALRQAVGEHPHLYEKHCRESRRAAEGPADAPAVVGGISAVMNQLFPADFPRPHPVHKRSLAEIEAAVLGAMIGRRLHVGNEADHPAEESEPEREAETA